MSEQMDKLPVLNAHGAKVLPSVEVDSYNLEIRDEDGFIGDKASKSAFQSILEKWREPLRKLGADPLGDKPTEDISKKKLDALLAEGDPEVAGVIHSAIEEFASELKGVIRRFLKSPSWRDTECIVVGGGFRASRVGESKAEISFRQIHKPTGKRINYTKTVPGVGAVENADIVKGYEVDEDTYVTLDPDDVEAIRLESKKTIDLVKFVKVGEIDQRYLERPYFVVPADEMAGEGYVVVRDALTKTGMAGLAQITISGREWLVAVSPLGDGLVMEMLRYAEELRNPEDYFDDVPTTKPDKEMVDLAVQLIEKKSAPFKAEQFQDHYATAHRFGNLAKAFRTLRLDAALIDGEVVILDDTGVSSFVRLVEALRAGRSLHMVFFAFDLLHLDGVNLLGAVAHKGPALHQCADQLSAPQRCLGQAQTRRAD